MLWLYEKPELLKIQDLESDTRKAKIRQASFLREA